MKRKPKVVHFLWAMNFMKQYSFKNASCARFHCDKKTWRKWTWMYAKAIARLVPQVVSRQLIANYYCYYQLNTYIFLLFFRLGLKNWFKTNKKNVCLMTLDGTDFQIWEPRPYYRTRNEVQRWWVLIWVGCWYTKQWYSLG